VTPGLLGFVRVLSAAGVDYVIVGGVAAAVDGEPPGAARTAKRLPNSRPCSKSATGRPAL
jgi:hypothetical protein